MRAKKPTPAAGCSRFQARQLHQSAINTSGLSIEKRVDSRGGAGVGGSGSILGGRAGGIATFVIMVMVMGSLGGAGVFQILLQCCKGRARGREVARLQSGLKRLKIFADLAGGRGLLRRIVGCAGNLRGFLCVLLKAREGLLGCCEVARLEGAAKGLEVLSALVRGSLRSGLPLSGRGTDI